jgi:hypothetical protein
LGGVSAGADLKQDAKLAGMPVIKIGIKTGQARGPSSIMEETPEAAVSGIKPWAMIF